MLTKYRTGLPCFSKLIRRKLTTIIIEKTATYRWKELKVEESLQKNISCEIKKLIEDEKAPPTFTTEDQKLIHQIKAQTKRCNENNVTRTKAYSDFYLSHPEVHWSLLAHMVSRNGGWNMTDLKGDLISAFLNQQQVTAFFSFLETSNSVIFQDAYPQLLLYEVSKQQKKNIFHLLPAFNVSMFMKPFWDEFFDNSNSQLLTISLIINEQNVIQKRVIENKRFEQKVFHTLSYHAQELFQFTKVIFPYYSKNRQLRLAGVGIANFQNLKERIQIGKKLYSILFGIEEVHKGVIEFVNTQDHTGSRADYSSVFSRNPINNKDSCTITKEVCLTDTHAKAYSPCLEEAWKNHNHESNNSEDWFQEQSVLNEFNSVLMKKRFDITDEYCESLTILFLLSNVKGGK